MDAKQLGKAIAAGMARATSGRSRTLNPSRKKYDRRRGKKIEPE